MAKFKESIFLPGLRGRNGASVFNKNRYGNYIANKTIPINPQTEAQMRVRHTLGSLSQIWSYNLNEQQYIGWTKLVNKFKFTDSSGNSYKPAPRDIFTSFNFNLSEVGLPINLDPPEKFSVQTFSEFSLEIITPEDKSGLLLHFKPAINKDTRIMILATYALRNSIFYFRDNLFKKIGYIDNSFKSGDSLLSLYRSFPGNTFKFNGNFKIALRIKPISISSGYAKDLIEISDSVFQVKPR